MDKDTTADVKKVLVTGATGAIGEAIARQIAAGRDFHVTLVARDENKARQCVDGIIRRTGNTKVAFELVDLSSRTSIKAFSTRWQEPLFALVNNAVIAPRERTESADGIELQFATNVLGYLWMTLDFVEQLKAGSPARVVNVASNYAGGLDLSDLEFKRRPYEIHSAYRQSKQANRMLSAALAEFLIPEGIAVNACHPGVVNSQLTQAMGTSGPDSPDDGARTAVWLAAHPQAGRFNGMYFVNRRASRDRFTEDRQKVNQLFKKCMQY